MSLEHLLAHPLLVGPARLAHRSRLLVLSYHGVPDSDAFRRHLEWLRSTRDPISLSEVAALAASGRPVPPNRFLVTFDDGRRSVLANGLPLLESMDIPAVLFVVAGLIGSDEPYWWDEAEQLSLAGGKTPVCDLVGQQLVRYLKVVPDRIRLDALSDLRSTAPRSARPYPHLTVEELRLLHRSGVEIGNHSLTHPMLDRCGAEKALRELTASRRLLEEWLETPVRALAYPNGNADEGVVEAARKSGHVLGFLFDHHLQSRHLADPLQVSRVRVDAASSVDRLAGIASGILPFLHSVRRKP